MGAYFIMINKNIRLSYFEITCDYCKKQTGEIIRTEDPTAPEPNDPDFGWLQIQFALSYDTLDFCCSQCVKDYLDFGSIYMGKELNN